MFLCRFIFGIITPYTSKIIISLSFLLGTLFSYQATLRGVDFYSVRQAGMGMAYTAIANDETTLFVNPAGIGIKNRLFQIEKTDHIVYFFPIKFGYSQNLFHSLIFSEPPLANYLDIANLSLTYSVNFHSPTDFTYIRDFWGISFFTRGVVNVIDSDGLYNVLLQAKVTSQFNIGFRIYSFSLLSNEDFHIGMGAKFIYLMQIEKLKSNTEIANEFQELFDNPSVNVVTDILARNINYFEGIALGLDFGILWEIIFGDTEHQLNLGVSINDAPTYAIGLNFTSDAVLGSIIPTICRRLYEEIVSQGRNITVDIDQVCVYDQNVFGGAESWFYKFNLKTGIAYMLPNYLGPLFRDTIVAFDVHRIGDLDYSFSEMYHVGISTTLFDATDERTGYSYRMNLSLGVSQNQFNAGYLIHLNIYQIGYNYFREVIPIAKRVIHRHELTFAFYF